MPSHRDLSITGHITNDPATFAKPEDVKPLVLDALRRQFKLCEESGNERHMHPVVLPKWLYDAAKREGFNMVGYIRQEPIPTTGHGVYIIDHPMPTSKQMRDGIKRLEQRGERLGATHDVRLRPNLAYVGSVSGPRFGLSYKPKWPCPGEKKE